MSLGLLFATPDSVLIQTIGVKKKGFIPKSVLDFAEGKGNSITYIGYIDLENEHSESEICQKIDDAKAFCE